MSESPIGSATGADVVPPASKLTRNQRWFALGRTGATVWFTGLSASGKSTIAAELELRLVRMSRPAYRLDGDVVRTGLNGDLGFDAASRTENLRRLAEVAKLFADSGQVAIVSAISPLAEQRAFARQLHAEAGLPFVEVFVDTPLEVCEARDPKGMYARARRGEIADFTGVSSPYEAPTQPDVHLREHPINEALDLVVWKLDEVEATLG